MLIVTPKTLIWHLFPLNRERAKLAPLVFKVWRRYTQPHVDVPRHVHAPPLKTECI